MPNFFQHVWITRHTNYSKIRLECRTQQPSVDLKNDIIIALKQLCNCKPNSWAINRSDVIPIPTTMAYSYQRNDITAIVQSFGTQVCLEATRKHARPGRNIRRGKLLPKDQAGIK